MAYKVIITSFAKIQLDKYIKYTAEQLENKIAAKAILTDARNTKIRLSEIASYLPLCSNSVLAEKGYRRIMFSDHQFFMIYRIEGDSVIVEAMYHTLQDYECLFLNK